MISHYFFFVTFVNSFNFFDDNALICDVEIFFRDVRAFCDRDSRCVVVIRRRRVRNVDIDVNQIFVVVVFFNLNIVMTIFFNFQQMTLTSTQFIIDKDMNFIEKVKFMKMNEMKFIVFSNEK